jgi:hypothetical protein
MRRKPTHKQIEASGWAPFLQYVVSHKVDPKDVNKAALIWASYQAIMRLNNALDEIYMSNGNKKLLKITGLSKQVDE